MISGQDRQRARAALEDCSGSRVVHVPQVLSAEHCAMLRAFIDERVTGDALDMIDRCPEFQVDLTRPELPNPELEAIIGREAVGRLWSPPAGLPNVDAEALMSGTVGLFARKFGPESRHHLGFHVDQGQVSVNVALSDAGDFELELELELLSTVWEIPLKTSKGGIHGKKVEAAGTRGAGGAIVHHGDVAHGAWSS